MNGLVMPFIVIISVFAGIGVVLTLRELFILIKDYLNNVKSYNDENMEL
jgi:hypothetical protein